MRVIRTGVAVVLVAVTSVAAQAQAKPAAPAAAKPATADQPVKVKEDKPGLLKKAKITSEAAIATAQAKFPKAKISEAEIEDEDGKLIYSFALKTEGKSGIDEVNVDAMTGKVLKTEHESPESEAKEAKADKAKADKDKAAAAKPAPKKPI